MRRCVINNSIIIIIVDYLLLLLLLLLLVLSVYLLYVCPQGVPQQAVELEKVYQKEKVLAHLGLSWELCYKHERKIW